MTRRHDGALEGLMQEVFREDDGPKRVLEFLAERGMEAELTEHLQARPRERTSGRRGYRNGKKSRTLKTRVGELSIQVPQSRGIEPYQPSLYARWQRSEKALLVACAEMYFHGVSTRKVQDVLQAMCGLEISSGTVSRIAVELDEKLRVFRARKLTSHGYPYLVIDARYEKARVQHQIVSQAVLVTVGINDEGRREVLDWRVGDSESEATWSEVFQGLKDRGLAGVTMITSDQHKGIQAALRKHMQGIVWQRCRVHFMREAIQKARWKDQRGILAELQGVFGEDDWDGAWQRAQDMAVKWESRYPKLSAMIRDGIQDCLSVCALPSELKRKLHSTNLLEREMRELKRRTRVVGIFPNVAALDRLIGAQLVELDETWQAEERLYLNLEHLDRPEYRDRFKPLETWRNRRKADLTEHEAQTPAADGSTKPGPLVAAGRV